jgi:two-component system response regulator AtoC
MERAIALTDNEILQAGDLPPYLYQKTGENTRLYIPQVELSIKKVSRRVEEELIRRALEKTNGNRTRAAKLLEISHRALIYKIKEYELDKTLAGRLKSFKEGELEQTPNTGELK